MKKKLYLFTDNFPYGKSEKSFIIPELPYLQREFDVTIVSSAPLSEINTELETILDSDIRVFHYKEAVVKKIEIVKYIIPFLRNQNTWRELKYIIKSREKIFPRLKKVIYFFACAEKFRRWLIRTDILDTEDIICYSYWYVYRVLSLIMSKKENSQMKIITRAHRYDLYEETNSCNWQPYKRVLDQYIDKIVFISQHGYDYYMKYFVEIQEDKEKYEICRLGTKAQKEKYKSINRNPFLLVSCSNTILVKRVNLIIEALGLIQNRSIKWVHFGNGDEYENLIMLAEKRLRNKVNICYEFKGYTGNDGILDYYEGQMPDCFIMTSKSEGSPVAMQEAISFGIPVIGTMVGGIPEMIDGNGILLSEEPSIEEVAEAIRSIYDSDEKAYSLMRERSIAIWKSLFIQDENVRHFIDVLKDL